MFTGLVEALGTVRSVRPAGCGRELVLVEEKLAPQLAIGESLAVNGACLTVVNRAADSFSFEVVPETLRCTNLGELQPGDRINLERALFAGARLGGHIVQGHVDGVGIISERAREGDWETVRIDCAHDLACQMISKGSVAVDGVSLTVVNPTAAGFSVALIPHTLASTTLGGKQAGARVNIETDFLGKYVWKYLEELTRNAGGGQGLVRKISE